MISSEIRDLCLDCKYLYFEDIWYEAMCKKGKLSCYISKSYSNGYEWCDTCDKFEKDKGEK